MAGENVPVGIVVHVLDLVNSLWQRHHDSKDAAVLHPDGKGPAGMQGQTMAIWSDTSDASGRIISGRIKRQPSVSACGPAPAPECPPPETARTAGPAVAYRTIPGNTRQSRTSPRLLRPGCPWSAGTARHLR